MKDGRRVIMFISYESVGREVTRKRENAMYKQFSPNGYVLPPCKIMRGYSYESKKDDDALFVFAEIKDRGSAVSVLEDIISDLSTIRIELSLTIDELYMTNECYHYLNDELNNSEICKYIKNMFITKNRVEFYTYFDDEPQLKGTDVANIRYVIGV